MSDPLDYLHKRLQRVERFAERSMTAPTAPSYDQTNFPQDAVVGQFAIGLNNEWYFYGLDNAWHVSAGNVAPGAWHYVGNTGEPAFLGAWVNAGGFDGATRFRIVTGLGVDLEIAVSGGAPNTVVFQLPTGFIPPAGDVPGVGTAEVDHSKLSSWKIDSDGFVWLVKVTTF